MTDRHGPERVTMGRSVVGRLPTTTQCFRVGGTLIDAGPPNMAADLADHVSAVDISHVLLTHQHEDHVGAAARLAELGAVVFAPAGALGVLREPGQLPTFRSVAWGDPEPVVAEPFVGKVRTPDGTFEVVPTPGHSPDHVALFEVDRGWLFAGDAHLGRREEHRFDEQLGPMVSSFRRMRGLEPDVLFPGHGAVVTDPVSTLEATLSYYEDLHARAWALRGGGLALPQVTRDLLGVEGPIKYYTSGEFSKRNLVRQLLTVPPGDAFTR